MLVGLAHFFPILAICWRCLLLFLKGERKTQVVIVELTDGHYWLFDILADGVEDA